MRKRRLTVLLLLALCSCVSVLLGYVVEMTGPPALIDLQAVYGGTRCLLEHIDPYNETEMLALLRREEGVIRPPGPGHKLQYQAVSLCVNLPSSFLFMIPFALLPFGVAHALWTALTAANLTFAAFLMWDVGARYAPDSSFYLVVFVLGNSVILFLACNSAGVVVSLCVIAVWCFLKNRFAAVGVICLAVSLAIKPHDGGLVWLYFLFAGGVYRRRALQTLALAIVLSIPAFGWVTLVAPHWIPELRANLLASSAPGDINDPGLSSITSHSSEMIIDLQSVLSVFWTSPRIFNGMSYFISAVLLLIFSLRALRSRATPATAWVALAALSPLTMLATYHRTHDAKLLLLAIPACAILSAERGRTGRLALGLTTAAIIFTSDFPLLILVNLTRSIHIDANRAAGRLLEVILIRPVPVILLIMAAFYLCVYLLRSEDRAGGVVFRGSNAAPVVP